MQQFYMLEKEWAAACQLKDIENQMFQKYLTVFEQGNLCEDKDKKSIFMVEHMFQGVQEIYYNKQSPARTTTAMALQVKEMEMLLMDNGLYES